MWFYNEKIEIENLTTVVKIILPKPDFSGDYFRTNVVETLKAVYSPEDCQTHCQRWKKRGCVAFVYQEAKLGWSRQ